MTIYKAIMRLLKANKGTLLIGIAITMFITLAQSGQIRDEQTTLQTAKIVILSNDDSPLTAALSTYLKEEQRVVTLDDTSQKTLDDALYFGQIDYILTIPESFTRALTAGKKTQLTIQTKPGTYTKTLVNTTINQFLNTFLLYQKAQPHLSQQEVLQQTTQTLRQQATVKLDHTYTQKVNQSIAGRFINLLAYGLFSTIFSAYGLVNLAFNRPEIKMRNSCSPVSRRRFSRKIAIATISYALLAAIGFSGFIMYVSKLANPQIIGLFSLSILAFFLTMITFSTLVTSLVKSSETISGVNNVFILGSCFISGVFVPSEFLPDIVNKIAAFTPTYWFVRSNMLIGETITYDTKFFEALGLNLFVLLAFSAVFMVLHFMNMREKGVVSLIPHKRTTR